MPNNFHEIALKSILFKGRDDLYFCYLKSEKIAHVLAILAQKVPFKDKENFEELTALSARLPNTILYFVAGQISTEALLADLLSLISQIRISTTEGLIHKDTSLILCQEYENLTRKIAAENQPSPFVSAKDFTVEEIKLPPPSQSLFPAPAIPPEVKKTGVGNIKDIDKGQNERSSLILDLVRKNNGISIKDIAAVIKGCSEKTIQRELAQLIEKGLIERRGERRWSIYIAVG